jgi:hypothetical protein
MTNTETASKITARHLARKAVVYLRQSSIAQVRTHVESTRLQYALKDTAKAYGFSEVEVIDVDLGISASSGAQARAGFKQLLASVALGEVGIVCLDATICGCWRSRSSAKLYRLNEAGKPLNLPTPPLPPSTADGALPSSLVEQRYEFSGEREPIERGDRDVGAIADVNAQLQHECDSACPLQQLLGRCDRFLGERIEALSKHRLAPVPLLARGLDPDLWKRADDDRLDGSIALLLELLRLSAAWAHSSGTASHYRLSGTPPLWDGPFCTEGVSVLRTHRRAMTRQPEDRACGSMIRGSSGLGGLGAEVPRHQRVEFACLGGG